MNTAGANECPLPWPDQRRNLILFAVCTGIQYLAAPVLYVGITQASLCDRLGGDTRTSNLPSTLFFAMTAFPALLAWLSPQLSALKRNLICCYFVTVSVLALTAILLASPVSNQLKMAAVILQGGVSGAAMPAVTALQWEVLGRGVAESRRGLTLALAYGLGPLMAVVGSLVQTALLGGSLFGITFTGIEHPYGFIVLFGAGAPIVALGGILSQWFVLPQVTNDIARTPLHTVYGLLLGIPLMFVSVAAMQISSVSEQEAIRWLGYVTAIGATAALVYHFRDILQQRVLFTATVVTVLVYAGNMIPSNMNLYSEYVLGDIPEKFAGLQNTIRFSFKVTAGLFLGWLLTRTNPRAGILVTSGIFLFSQIWAMLVTGPWYLLAFGIYGAGELVGVYAPNYILSASKPTEVRRNMAFMTMLMAPAAPAGYLYGAIVDFVKECEQQIHGLSSTELSTLGFRLSFLVCAGLIGSGLFVAWRWLPSRPTP
ncbi:MAG: hypothetical protein O2931_04880 [Planctomycetota bacterium]|nr:hypothetical protein [Planctomycetota bacterium]MDA1178116.1 hypothetical protein [Planctomycetota bacterium]